MISELFHEVAYEQPFLFLVGLWVQKIEGTIIYKLLIMATETTIYKVGAFILLC